MPPPAKWIWIIEVCLFAVLAMPRGLAAQEQRPHSGKPQQYKLEILDTLGGTFGLGAGLNNRGSVAGFASLPEDSAVHAFLWQNGIITDLGTLGGPKSITTLNVPVNARGMMVGSSNILTPDPSGEDFCGIGFTLICLPFVWQKGVMTALPLLGGNNGSANGINNRGQVVGLSETPNYDPCSFASLQVEAVIWKDGNLQELPPFPGDAIGNAFAINNQGQVVGQSDLPGSSSRLSLAKRCDDGFGLSPGAPILSRPAGGTRIQVIRTASVCEFLTYHYGENIRARMNTCASMRCEECRAELQVRKRRRRGSV